MDQVFLYQTPFIGGSDVSIADLSAYCETQQLVIIDFDFTPYRSIVTWRQRMREVTVLTQFLVTFSAKGFKLKISPSFSRCSCLIGTRFMRFGKKLLHRNKKNANRSQSYRGDVPFNFWT